MDSEHVQSRLHHLWECWSVVLGDMARLACPLGHRGQTLLLGCEDSMASQEITMRAKEILERTTAFLGRPLFKKIRAEVILGRHTLIEPLPALPVLPAPVSRATGKYLSFMPPDSPVGRCYAEFSGKNHSDAPGRQTGHR